MKLTYRLLEKDDFPQVAALTAKYVNTEQDYCDYMRCVCDSLGHDSAGIAALDDNGQIVGALITEKGMHLTGGREDFFAQIKEDIGSDEI